MLHAGLPLCVCERDVSTAYVCTVFIFSTCSCLLYLPVELEWNRVHSTRLQVSSFYLSQMVQILVKYFDFTLIANPLTRAHLYKMNITDSEKCGLCGEPETIIHASGQWERAQRLQTEITTWLQNIRYTTFIREQQTIILGDNVKDNFSIDIHFFSIRSLTFYFFDSDYFDSILKNCTNIIFSHVPHYFLWLGD